MLHGRFAALTQRPKAEPCDGMDGATGVQAVGRACSPGREEEQPLACVRACMCMHVHAWLPRGSDTVATPSSG